MISRISKGSGFTGTLAYVLNDKPGGMENRAEIIGGNMAGQTPQELAREFRDISNRNSRVAKPVRHFSLRLPENDKQLTAEQWQEVGSQFLEKLGYGNCQRVMVLHSDGDTSRGGASQHCHIVCNAIDATTGRKVNDFRDVFRAKAACRELEKEHGLIQVSSTKSANYKTGNHRTWQVNSARAKALGVAGHFKPFKQSSGKPAAKPAAVPVPSPAPTPAPAPKAAAMPKGEQVEQDNDPGDMGVNALAATQAQLVAQLSQVKGQIAQARNPLTALKLQQQAAAIEQQLKAIAQAISRAMVNMRNAHANKHRRRLGR